MCGLAQHTHCFFGSEAERGCALRIVSRGRGVLLSTYGMVLHNAGQLLGPGGGVGGDDGFQWDLVIADEGHKVGGWVRGAS